MQFMDLSNEISIKVLEVNGTLRPNITGLFQVVHPSHNSKHTLEEIMFDEIALCEKSTVMRLADSSISHLAIIDYQNKTNPFKGL